MSGADRKLSRSQGSTTGQVQTGLVAPFTRQTIARPDGVTTLQLSLDISELPAPPRSYSADAASASFNGSDAVHLLFWQLTVAKKPRSMVAVKMYAGAARRFYESSEAMRPSLEDFMRRNKVAVARVEVGPEEPAQSVSLVASLAQVSFAGFEAEVSFFHLSPYAVHNATRRNYNQVAVEAVVQVDLSTTMLVSILDQLRELLPNVPQEDQP
jgi:hypothetical protein